MRYLSKTFTLPASPRITQAAWDAIWNPPPPPDYRREFRALCLAREHHSNPVLDGVAYPCKCGFATARADFMVNGCIISRATSNSDLPGADDELPPQNLPLDPSTPVRFGLPGGCF